MAKCRFCGKRFPSPQAVLGHLQWCPRYHGGREPKAQSSVKAEQPKARPAYIGSEPRAGGIAEPVLDELQAERAKLDLRKVKTEHRRLDEEEQERARREEETREHERRERQDRARARREAEEQAEREARRRELIQDAKRRVETSRVGGRTIPLAIKAQALRAVEEELASLARLEDLPPQEIRELAQGAWDGVVLSWVRAVEAEEERERRRQREAEEVKQRLIARGKRYAEGRLDAEGIEGLERFVILPKVEAALAHEVTGAETGPDVEGGVEEILAPEIARVRRQAEEHRRQEAEREARRREQEEARKRQEAERDRQLRELERQRRERQRERQERAEEARLAATRQRLASHGESYALRLLNEENELEPLERSQVAREVKEQLLDELEGDESEGEVEDLVEQLLDEELGE